MEQFQIIETDKPYVTSISTEELIRTPRDFLDLLAWGGEHATNLVLLKDTNFSPSFYNLTSGLAGEILQKVSNYHIRLAIYGSFEMVTGTRFRELMNESNKGRHVCFHKDKEQALSWLQS